MVQGDSIKKKVIIEFALAIAHFSMLRLLILYLNWTYKLDFEIASFTSFKTANAHMQNSICVIFQKWITNYFN